MALIAQYKADQRVFDLLAGRKVRAKACDYRPQVCLDRLFQMMEDNEPPMDERRAQSNDSEVE